MKSLTNRRNKNAVRRSNNWYSIKPSLLQKAVTQRKCDATWLKSPIKSRK